MGWSVTLKTDRDLTEAAMDELLNECPEWMQGQGFGLRKQHWGWSMAADVRMRGPRQVLCSGSNSISGGFAREFCDELARRLRQRKYRVIRGRRWFFQGLEGNGG